MISMWMLVLGPVLAERTPSAARIPHSSLAAAAARPDDQLNQRFTMRSLQQDSSNDRRRGFNFPWRRDRDSSSGSTPSTPTTPPPPPQQPQQQVYDDPDSGPAQYDSEASCLESCGGQKPCCVNGESCDTSCTCELTFCGCKRSGRWWTCNTCTQEKLDECKANLKKATEKQQAQVTIQSNVQRLQLYNARVAQAKQECYTCKYQVDEYKTNAQAKYKRCSELESSIRFYCDKSNEYVQGQKNSCIFMDEATKIVYAAGAAVTAACAIATAGACTVIAPVVATIIAAYSEDQKAECRRTLEDLRKAAADLCANKDRRVAQCNKDAAKVDQAENLYPKCGPSCCNDLVTIRSIDGINVC
jgi:hypothetical protein